MGCGPTPPTSPCCGRDLGCCVDGFRMNRIHLRVHRAIGPDRGDALTDAQRSRRQQRPPVVTLDPRVATLQHLSWVVCGQPHLLGLQACLQPAQLPLTGSTQTGSQPIQPLLTGRDLGLQGDGSAPLECQQALSLFAEQRCHRAQAKSQLIQTLALPVQTALQGAAPGGRAGRQLLARIDARRRRQFGRRRGRGSPQVGSQVTEGEVGLVANAADHRQGAGRHGAHHAFVVEGPKVFQRAATPHQQDRLHAGQAAGAGQGGHQRRRRIDALHGRRHDHHRHLRRTPLQGRQHNSQGRRIQRRHHRDRLWPGFDAAFAGRVEQALRFQPGAQAKQFFVQRAGAQALHRFDDELQFTAGLVDRQPPPHLHLLAVGGWKVEQRCSAAEHRAAQHCTRPLRILQREVAMPAGGPREAGQFATHGDGTEARGHRVPDGQQQRANAPGSCGQARCRDVKHLHATRCRLKRSPQSHGRRDVSARLPSRDCHRLASCCFAMEIAC